MEPPPLFAFKGFDQFANFESKLQHFGAEQILANMVHGKFFSCTKEMMLGAKQLVVAHVANLLFFVLFL